MERDRPGLGADPVLPRAQLRASDRDRERFAELIHTAHAEGRLDLAEFEERIQRVWGARTYGELERTAVDLPAATRPAAATPMASPAATLTGTPASGSGLRWRRSAIATWLTVSVLNLLVWASLAVATGEAIYPWWIWVAGPWGVMLLLGWLSRGVRGSACAMRRPT